MIDEPAYTSDRTDAESYADQALATMQHHGAKFLERQRGHVRDALTEAFLDGEHNECLRALTILRIARERTDDQDMRALLLEVAYILSPDLREDA
jgi:uncharacterized protein (DUF1330 family)